MHGTMAAVILSQAKPERRKYVSFNFGNVSYKYKNAQRNAVSDISCAFEEGKVAFDGDSLAALLEGVGITEEQMGRFLASNARIILGDEPTGNLDGANTQNIIDILWNLAHDKGYCVIIVTHDMEVAEAADVALRMRDGMLRAI